MEYAHTPIEEYRASRAKVMRSFLDANEHLYFTSAFRTEREGQAKQNIEAEVAMLLSGANKL